MSDVVRRGPGSFVRGTAATLVASLILLVIGTGTSVLLARLLGPEGKGLYGLAALLPALMVTFCNAGMGTATAYHVARRQFPLQEVLGTNLFLSMGIGGLGLIGGVALVVFFGNVLFPGVPRRYLTLALLLIPLQLLYSYVQHILLGEQQFKKYNLISILHAGLFLMLLLAGLVGLRGGVTEALGAAVLSWALTNLILLVWVKRLAGGISLKPNLAYIKDAWAYGWKTHLGNILGFLNYRVDMFLVNAFLNPAAVGFYAVGVGLVERLWLVSKAAGTVLFPRVAAEGKEERTEEFTPLVTRTVLWATALGAIVLVFLSRGLVALLYSDAFLPAVAALQALLAGIVALAGARVLANDIAGRGRPLLNTYVSILTLVSNIVLNLLWIPRYGIVGAAWASTASYSATFVARLIVYCRLSSNRWTVVVFPQQGDWALYWKTAIILARAAANRVCRAFQLGGDGH